MKTCTILDCENKHHAGGYCKKHYGSIILLPLKSQCSIDGCNEKAFGKGYCQKHYLRLKRNGDPEKTVRIRNHKSMREFIDNITAEDVQEYIFTDRAQWSYACKLYYGDKCSECDWCEVTCDVNHKQAKSKGGDNTIANGEVLCPNCHAKKHRGASVSSRKWLSNVKEKVYSRTDDLSHSRAKSVTNFPLSRGNDRMESSPFDEPSSYP